MTLFAPARRTSLRLLVVPALALCLAVPASARTAHDPHLSTAGGISVSSTMTDRDDTFGRLDISRVQDRALEVDRHHVIIAYRVRTFTPFGTRRLNDTERNFVLELDRDGEPGSERNVRVTTHDGVLAAEVISNATRQVIATVEVSRPNDQAVLLSGSRRVLGARSYFWTSNFHADRSPACGNQAGVPLTCQDSVPQRGWIHLNRLAWPGQG